MKEIVTFSMGICSAFIACRLKDQCGEPICLFSDTKREDADTYRFGWEVAKRWNLNVVEASDGRDLWEVFREQNCIPARQIPMCSIKLKIKPSQRCSQRCDGPGRVAYGYDVNEEERAERTRDRWAYEHLEPWFPLIEWGVTKEECFGYFAQHGIQPPRMYRHFQHANCLPCKNFRLNDWKALQFHYPERFEQARQFEEETGLRWMQDGPRLAELPVLDNAPSRKGRRALAAATPAFSFDMGCDACALD